MDTLNISELSRTAVALLDGYHLYNTITEAVEIAIQEFLNSDTFLDPYTETEISPLEMLDLVLEILSAYNKQVAK